MLASRLQILRMAVMHASCTTLRRFAPYLGFDGRYATFSLLLEVKPEKAVTVTGCVLLLFVNKTDAYVSASKAYI